MPDGSLPHIYVLMVKRDPACYPRYELPQGYDFCMFEPGNERDWARIQWEAGQFPTEEGALSAFQKVYAPRPEELPRRCFFVRDGEGRRIAAASLWFGDHFGEEMPNRLHYVAVCPGHEGRGIAKAMVTRALDLFGALGFDHPTYLTTETGTWPATMLYRLFGYEPYFGQMPPGWVRCRAEEFEELNQRAWAFIDAQTRNAENGRKKP